MPKIRCALWRLLLSCALVAGAAPGHAGSLGVSPIRVELAAAAPTAAITLENTGATPMVLQLQVTRWSATGNQDRYDATQDILATPPIMTIAPGRSQVVRLGLADAPTASRELAYRLFIEEVPPPPQPNQPALQVALRIGVPIFVAPKQVAQPKLAWAPFERDGMAGIELRNDGNAHARLLDLKLRGADGDVAVAGAAGYLLPGQARRLELPAQHRKDAARLAVSATTDRGPVDVELAPPAR